MMSIELPNPSSGGRYVNFEINNNGKTGDISAFVDQSNKNPTSNASEKGTSQRVFNISYYVHIFI